MGNVAAIGDIADGFERLEQQGINVRRVLADLRVADLDLVDDPAAYAADLLIDRADTGTFADVDARELSRAAGFINRTCYDAPDQARQVIEDPRFPSTVRAIIEAETNGQDPAELLAQVPRDTLAAVGEKARFAAHAVRAAASDRLAPGRIPTQRTTRPGTWTAPPTSSRKRGANTPRWPRR